MSTIGYIKGKVREIQPILEESTQVLMNCLEELRACGIFSEEIAHMATSVENLEKELNDSTAKYLRGRLSSKIEIRNTPELIFKYDESIEYGNNIEKILANIHKEEQK